MISVTDGLQINPSTNRRGDVVKGQINSLKMSYLNFPKNINTWFGVQLVLGRKLSTAGIISGAGTIEYLPEQPGWRDRTSLGDLHVTHNPGDCGAEVQRTLHT